MLISLKNKCIHKEYQEKNLRRPGWSRFLSPGGSRWGHAFCGLGGKPCLTVVLAVLVSLKNRGQTKVPWTQRKATIHACDHGSTPFIRERGLNSLESAHALLKKTIFNCLNSAQTILKHLDSAAMVTLKKRNNKRIKKYGNLYKYKL